MYKRQIIIIIIIIPQYVLLPSARQGLGDFELEAARGYCVYQPR